jgi:hypothetical protein
MDNALGWCMGWDWVGWEKTHCSISSEWKLIHHTWCSHGEMENLVVESSASIGFGWNLQKMLTCKYYYKFVSILFGKWWLYMTSFIVRKQIINKFLDILCACLAVLILSLCSTSLWSLWCLTSWWKDLLMADMASLEMVLFLTALWYSF